MKEKIGAKTRRCVRCAIKRKLCAHGKEMFRVKRYFGPGTFAWTVPTKYHYSSGLVVHSNVDTRPPQEVADIHHVGEEPTFVLFGAMNGEYFQHFVQDLWYVINAFRTCLQKYPNAVICVPPFHEAEALIRAIGIENEVRQIHLNEQNQFLQNQTALAVHFGDSSWEMLTRLSLPLRGDLWRRLGARIDDRIDDQIDDRIEDGSVVDENIVILITRPQGKSRSWDGEADLIEKLRQCCREEWGCTLVVFAPHTSPHAPTMEHMALFRRAKAVIAVHGGAAYHVVACKPGTLFLEVTVPNSFSFDWWTPSTDLHHVRIESSTGDHNGCEKVEAPESMFSVLDEHFVTQHARRQRVHVIVQPYRDPHPERDWEIMEALRRNLDHPSVFRVHALCESGVMLPEDILGHKKLVVRSPHPRMTFANAIAFAQENLQDGDTAVVLNGDIFLGWGDWELLGVDDGKVRWLTRWEMHPNGTMSITAEMFAAGYSSDAWAFQLPLARGPPEDCDFRVGNQMGCDSAISERFLRRGYALINDAVRFQVVHLDKCAHRERANSCLFSKTENKSTEETVYDYKAVIKTGSASVRVVWDDAISKARVAICDRSRNSMPMDDEEYLKTIAKCQDDVFWFRVGHLVHRTPRIILVDAVCGLANRIKAIVSALRLVGDNPMLVYINKWEVDDREDAPWNKLFDIPLQTMSTEWIEANKYHHSGWRLELTAKDKSLIPSGFASLRKFGNHDGDWKQIDFEFFRIPRQLRASYAETFRLLRPCRHIEEHVDTFLETNGFQHDDVPTLGIHLRLWNDDPIRRCGSELEEVTDAVSRFIDMYGEDVRIFVASDTPDEAIPALRNVSPRVSTFDRGACETQLEAAWCEMIILSKTKHLIVTRASTFSEVAWWIGGATANIFAQIGNGE